MYKYEMHSHTSQGSACGQISGDTLAEFYKKAGYQGLFVTDHFFNNGSCSVPKGLPWKTKIDLLFKGFEKAKKRGDEIGLDVFFAFEFSFNGTDFLVHGLGKDWLYKHKNCDKMPLPEFCDLVHKSGGYIVHAHPFREAFYIDMIKLLPHHVDAVEIYNGGNTDFQNYMAKHYAESYNIPAFCGTDNHHGFREFLTALEVPEKINSFSDIMKFVKEGNYKVTPYSAEETETEVVLTERKTEYDK